MHDRQLLEDLRQLREARAPATLVGAVLDRLDLGDSYAMLETAPGAVRAVGSALRKNPVPVLIPCHRVVRGDGHIGDYALGGSEAKRRILAAEGLDLERLAQDSRRRLAR